jgi:hypothetical protein
MLSLPSGAVCHRPGTPGVTLPLPTGTISHRPGTPGVTLPLATGTISHRSDRELLVIGAITTLPDELTCAAATDLGGGDFGAGAEGDLKYKNAAIAIRRTRIVSFTLPRLKTSTN